MKPQQLPSQIVPESQKGLDFIKQNLFAIKAMATHDVSSKQKDIECWYYFHNIYNEKEFEYLTKISSGTQGDADYYLPAKVRHIPIQRSKLNILIGQQKHRPFEFSSLYLDNDDKNERAARNIHNYFKSVSQLLEQRVSEFNIQLKGIDQQRQQLAQMLQGEPQNEQEAMQQQQLKMQLPMIEEQLGMIQKQLTSEALLNSEDLKQFERLKNFDTDDIIQDMVQKVVHLVRHECRVEDKSLKNFKSHITTGKQSYMVDYEPGDKYITFEPLNHLNVYYPMIEGIQWIQDGPWCMYIQMQSLNYLADKYKLSADEIKELEGDTYENPVNFDFFNTEFGKNINTKGMLYSGTTGSHDGIPEYKIWWRSQKKIQVKKSPNPHEDGKYFSHYLDDEDKVINEGQLYWDAKKKLYINKEDGREYDKKDVINTGKGESLETRYIDEIWQGTIIGSKIIKNYGKKPCRLYSNENYSWTVLPIIGPTFNDITERPYSLVWDTKDIQKTYNLINFHRELLLATSGVKGTIMDLSQMPEGMKKKEFLYYKKLGAMFIETMKKSGRQASYNQFGSYDDTVSASIQYIDNMLLMLDEMMGNIIGIPRQRQGQVATSDQVGTYQMAMEQSNLITEIIFSEHDEIERRALEVAANLAGKYVYNKGGNYQYMTKKLSIEKVEIPSNILSDMDIKIDLANNTMEERNLKELKQFAIGEYSKGMMPFKDLIKLYATRTVKDLESKFEQSSEEAFKLAQQNMQARGEQEQEIQMSMIKLQGEIQAQLKGQEMQLKQMEMQMKGQLEQMKLGLEDKKILMDKEKHAIDSNIKMLDIQSESAIEGLYVQEQNRSNVVNEQLEAIKMEMDMLKDRVSGGKSSSSSGGGKKGKPMFHVKDS